MLKRNISSILYVIIIIAVALFVMNKCDNNIRINQKGNDSDTLIIYRTDTIRDTIFSVDTITVSIPKVITVEVPFYIDTNKVIKDYYVIREYTDTIVNDSDLVVITKETIQHNKLQSIIVTHKNMRPTVINNTKYIITPESNHLYVGGFLNGSKTFLDYGPQIIYTKKKWAYNAGFGFNNKAVYIGVNFKIK